MRSSGRPEGLGSLLRDSLRALDLQTRVNEQTCLMVWDEVVGEQVSSAAQPEFIRDGQIFVTTKSSVWANELTMYKRDIISRLNARVGAGAVKDIVFKAGKVARRKPKTANHAQDQDLAGIPLTRDEIEKVEAIARGAGHEASESFKELLLTATRLEKWKKAQGWTPCRDCGTLQHSQSGMCPPCEMKS